MLLKSKGGITSLLQEKWAISKQNFSSQHYISCPTVKYLTSGFFFHVFLQLRAQSYTAQTC